MLDSGKTAVSAGLGPLLPRLWRFAVVLSGDRQRADDLVQATCLRALERAEQFAPGTRLDHWTFAILASILRNEQRRSRRSLKSQDHLLELAKAIGPRPADQTLLMRQMLALVARLPDAQRSVVHLVYLEQYTCREASEILDIPVGTVLSRLAAARQAMATAAGQPPKLAKKDAES